MNNLYDALENCLQAIEQGADIETTLIRYPDLADELRPLLETSMQARRKTFTVPAMEVVRRNRAKVLQHAAEMREAKARKSSRRIWAASLRRLTVTLAVIAVVFASGTGLVRAASTTLPGDNLYPVKRTWEDVLVFFTFDPRQRDMLEVEQENERLHEMRELFAEGRSSQVDFSGVVTSQNKDQWLVAGFSIIIAPHTNLPSQQVSVGAAIRVIGQTQVDGTIFAEQIVLLPPGASLPDVEENTANSEGENTQEDQQTGEEHPGQGGGGETATPAPAATAVVIETTKPDFEPVVESFDGVVESMNGNVWIINGNTYDVSNAEINGTPGAGAVAKIEGYVNENGVFVVTKIEFTNNESNNGSSSISDDGNPKGGGDQGNDNSNDNGDPHGGDDNGSDDGGHEDNSNSNDG